MLERFYSKIIAINNGIMLVIQLNNYYYLKFAYVFVTRYLFIVLYILFYAGCSTMVINLYIEVYNGKIKIENY